MIVSTLLGFWQLYKCRRHVLGRLRPVMDQWRAAGGPQTQWSDPLAVGFLSTVVTLMAQRLVGPLESDPLASLQSDLWAALTGLPPDLIGEQIVALSVAADPRFAEGCRRAFVFEAALDAAHNEGRDRLGPETADDLFRTPGARDDLLGLWTRLLTDPTPIDL